MGVMVVMKVVKVEQVGMFRYGGGGRGGEVAGEVGGKSLRGAADSGRTLGIVGEIVIVAINSGQSPDDAAKSQHECD